MLEITKDEATLWYRRMLLLRRFEEKCAELYNATKIRGFLHLYIGEGAIAEGEFHESMNLRNCGSCRCSLTARITSTRWAQRSRVLNQKPI
ncbi:MAG: hypothetical protein OHK0011_06060 [Turneriella sp.]